MHRRNEMDTRICFLMSKCDLAQANIKRLEMQAQKLVQQLNCDPIQLKDRFLNSMKLLDEYIYLVTDFNLSVDKIAETAETKDVPVQDSSPNQQAILTPTKAHLLDVLSEPLPSTSTRDINQHKPKKVAKTPKSKKLTQEELLIEFSSNSCSQESVSCGVRTPKMDKASQIELPVEDMCNLTLQEPSGHMNWNLPAQKVLSTDTAYEGFIIHIDGASMWMITDELGTACDLMKDICSYYKTHLVVMSHERMMAMTYCAYYDHETDCWYRCLLLKLDNTQREKEPIDLFLVDTGEMRAASPEQIQPLAQQFCMHPPLARCCHLAGVDMMSNCNKELLEKRDVFLKQFIGEQCMINVDDNTSESLGVFVLLNSGKILNDILVNAGLADMENSNVPDVESVKVAHPRQRQGPPEMRQSQDDVSDLDVDITDLPEHEDPLEAVTGYHNRDEMDICKHYKGPPNKGCFKGDRCTKRHVMKHPDGWTLDRVEVTAKCLALPLPAPATWHRVIVTHVAHFDYVFVQYVTQTPEEQRRTFGTVLPPMTLASLIEDMNSPAGRAALLPLKLAPAPGEIVAALYPPDRQWYRAMVISLTNHDQSVEVRYVDFGTDVWVKENNIRQLDPAHTLLPFQAVKCKLAGVSARSEDLEEWVKAKQQLQKLTIHHRELQMHVVSRGYDELEVELYNAEGSIAELLAKDKLVTLTEFTVQDESAITQRVVVP